MIRHLLKLVWHRKRSNALLAIEIFLSFLVVFAVATGAVSFLVRWTDPLGYDWHDVWTVRIDVTEMSRESSESTLATTVERLLREAKAFPQVVDAAASQTPAYALSTTEGLWRVRGRQVRITWDSVTDGFANVMRVKLLRGRWFRPDDDALGYDPVVIDSDLARAMYDDADPIGQKFDEMNGRVLRVVGVVAPYRKDGELSRNFMNMAFRRCALGPKYEGRVPRNIVIRVQPGTPASFEQRLTQRLHDVAPNLAFRVRRMDRMRDQALRIRSAPMIAGGVVALFLIAMVGVGLTGVLWQNVTRRTREIGLRRALGASGGSVRAQVLGEVALLTTLAILLGLAIVLQLPLLGLLSVVTPAVFGAGVVAALLVIYAITVACGAYPAVLASRIEPAEALRYE